MNIVDRYKWDESALDRLRALWDEGTSAQEIGRQIGTTKNSVVGKAHRLGLPGRPSPIPLQPRRGPRSLRPPDALAAIREMRTLPPLPTAALPPVPPRPHAALVARGGTLPSVRAMVATAPVRTCQFPIGDPREPGFMFCGEPVERDENGVPTGSYCWRCRRRCYTPTRRQEWVAEVEA